MSLLHVGIDIGSTTAKAVVLDAEDRVLYSRYARHFADIRTAAGELMVEIGRQYDGSRVTMAVAGSGGIAIAEGIEIPFAQEMVACSTSIERYLPHVDVCIELGGEDAKLTFFDKGGVDQRMNETCAGGTGAFLDQMAALIGTDVAGLNELAREYETIYPIASRCGVFAKTDVQPLLNDGASRADIAASIFQAVVNQTISGLACGRRITGNVAFLGGPLFFLSELRSRFIETLALTPERCIFPENPHLFVAIGAAILGKKNGEINIPALRRRALRFFSSKRSEPESVLPALFMDDAQREEFKARHGRNRVARAPISGYKGDAYLGVDVGSTTTKVVLIGSDGELLFSRYLTGGGGDPLSAVQNSLCELYDELPHGVTIRSSGVTGYGENLTKAAFGIEVGEVETVAHARAAEFLCPGVEFVIDIGGQDMKCLGVKDGIVRRVFLNEACSSGCGSFLQSFAELLGMSVHDFALAAESSLMPVDLGSRCTVFMNSRVRQAQKEGASVRDISSGLAYSVVRNALYKVLKIRNVDELGSRIVVQGGAFKNDALLRAFELITGREVVRLEIPELMGALGAALLARDRAADSSAVRSSLLDRDSLRSFAAKTEASRCKGCGNRCILTATRFEDGRSYVSGNRCERGAPSAIKGKALPNVCAMKYARLFESYTPLDHEEAPRGVIGIPRALNMYENYPFWFTLFTKLGFRVELSRAAPDEHLGIDTIPSQTLCYPAKLVHRHLVDLVRRGVRRIFYPGIQKEKKEFAGAHQNFNCPVITGYPDVAWLNIDELRGSDVNYLHPFLPIDSPRAMLRELRAFLPALGVKAGEVGRALDAAYAEQEAFKRDIRRYGDETLAQMRVDGGIGVVIAGHPYHLDPDVNHGIPELAGSYGVYVFTEDSICHKAEETDGLSNLRVIDQWVYHSRLYRAAAAIARHPDCRDLHMVQLNSFGCGLDAISADQTAELLESQGRLHTLIKIDEGKNNGAVKIRLRSLLAAVRGGKGCAGAEPAAEKRISAPRGGLPAHKKGIRRRTILCPPLSTHHFQFLDTAMQGEGVDFRVLPEGSRSAVELGLKYVNNDACYPAMVVVGQFLDAFRSGAYDPQTTDCLYAQTGGACRASNYVPILRRALDEAGYAGVRIVAANAQGDGVAEPFSVSAGTLWRGVLSLLYGDMLMRLILRTRPYELAPGSANSLYDFWAGRCRENVARGSWHVFKRDMRDMAADFQALPIDPAPRPRVGIVGEILVKYHANANERLVEIVESEGGEAVVPDLANFLLYCLFDPVFSNRRLSGGLLPRLAGQLGIGVLERLRRPMKEALRGTRFGEIHDIYEMESMSQSMFSSGNQGGEGWLLAAEMMRLIEGGVPNVVCVQPFACLPNHITGKGAVKELKRRYKGANILALDYDPSVSTVNQLNRIKLLMSTARKWLPAGAA